MLGSLSKGDLKDSDGLLDESEIRAPSLSGFGGSGLAWSSPHRRHSSRSLSSFEIAVWECHARTRGEPGWPLSAIQVVSYRRFHYKASV